MSRSGANNPQMVHVVFLELAVDEDVIKVDHQEVSYVGIKDLGHEAHKSAWGI